MPRSTLRLAILSASAVTGCAKAVDLDAERTALGAADAAYTAVAATMEPDGFAAMYAADAKIYPPNDSARTTPEAVRAFAAQFAGIPNLSLTFHPLEVDVAASGDLGYTLNHYVVSFTGPDGNPVGEQGRDFHVWRKQADGAWKITIDIWNSEQPAAGMAGQ